MSDLTPSEALNRLKTGNRLYVAGANNNGSQSTPSRRAELVNGQQPFAAILSCSDSRVPAEIIFAQGLGDLFVVRVAGNIAAASQIGSVEYAVANLGVSLVVVLGHTHCGAVEATLNALDADSENISSNLSPNLTAIIDCIRPSMQTLRETCSSDERDTFLRKAVRVNVQATVEKLQQESDILNDFSTRGKLEIVGAEYSLATGEVAFF